MGSHYIQVGKLKIDQDLMNVICPAAGFTPELICTIENGYIPNPDAPYEPPVSLPEAGSGEILLLCDDTGYGAISIYGKTSSGLIKVEIFTSTMFPVLSTTFTSNTTYTYTFPTFNEGANYIIRLNPNTAGQNLTEFRIASTVGFPDEDSSVLVISINAPNLTSLANLIKNNQHIKTINYLCDLDALISLATAYQNSSVKTINYPASMAALTTISGAYRDITTQPVQIDISGVYLPLLADLSNFAYQCNATLIKLPASLPAVTTMNYFAFRTALLTTLQLPTAEMPALTTMTYAFQYCNISEIQLPHVPALANITNAFSNMPNLKKLIFNGSTLNAITATSNWVASSPNIEELILPESVTSGTFTTIALSKLKKYGNPTSISASYDQGLYTAFVYGLMVEELTRPVVSPTFPVFVNFMSKKLTSFYQPGLRFTQFRIGNTFPLTIAQCTSVEMDWAGSSCSGGVFIIAALLDSTELNRIMTALPSVSGKTLNILNNPGRATCDTGIATAKGWTVI